MRDHQFERGFLDLSVASSECVLNAFRNRNVNLRKCELENERTEKSGRTPMSRTAAMPGGNAPAFREPGPSS